MPAIGDGSVEHQHLPGAIGLRLGDERRVKTKQLTECVALDQIDDAVVELLRCRAEAVRSFRVMGVSVVARRDERDALARRFRCLRDRP